VLGLAEGRTPGARRSGTSAPAVDGGHRRTLAIDRIGKPTADLIARLRVDAEHRFIEHDAAHGIRHA
jgi:hypothetical protein